MLPQCRFGFAAHHLSLPLHIHPRTGGLRPCHSNSSPAWCPFPRRPWVPQTDPVRLNPVSGRIAATRWLTAGLRRIVYRRRRKCQKLLQAAGVACYLPGIAWLPPALVLARYCAPPYSRPFGGFQVPAKRALLIAPPALALTHSAATRPATLWPARLQLSAALDGRPQVAAIHFGSHVSPSGTGAARGPVPLPPPAPAWFSWHATDGQNRPSAQGHCSGGLRVEHQVLEFAGRAWRRIVIARSGVYRRAVVTSDPICGYLASQWRCRHTPGQDPSAAGAGFSDLL